MWSLLRAPGLRLAATIAHRRLRHHLPLLHACSAVPGGPGPASFVSPDPQYFQSANKAAGGTGD